MLFNSSSFALFFAAFYLLWRFFIIRPEPRVWLIALGSLAFYAAWDWRFVPVLVCVSLASFLFARLIDSAEKASAERRRLALLTAGVASNLAILFYFKFAGLFSGASFIVPVGVSFYTFQGIGYLIDVHRRQFKARPTPWSVLAAISFFPHLVAGPIVRSSTLLPQIEASGKVSSRDAQEALLLVSLGLLKKSLGDWLSVPADSLFSQASHGHGLDGVSAHDAWVGALAFMGQIYADFSGYSDIAIGVSLLLGVRLPPNFNKPFLSRSPAEFWRRWHISLGQWFRDYLYLPLAVRLEKRVPERIGGARIALFVSFVFIGVWHGANLTFLAYGAYYGSLVLLTSWTGKRFSRLAGPWAEASLVTATKILGTFYFVTLGMILFRSGTLGQALDIVEKMHRPGPGTGSIYSRDTPLLVAAGLLVVYGLGYLGDSFEAIRGRSLLVSSVTGVFFALAIALGGAGPAFIYYQF
jgi:alginate O-acetyltransferase complex protein AlgI